MSNRFPTISHTIDKYSGTPSYVDGIKITESNGRYNVVNPFQYVGFAQFGKAALETVGVYQCAPGERQEQEHCGRWGGVLADRYGIRSLDDFLGNTAAQDEAFVIYTRENWRQAERAGLEQYIGQTRTYTDPITGEQADFVVSPSSILMAMHLGGAGGAARFFAGDADDRDANGSSVGFYAFKGSMVEMTESQARSYGIAENKIDEYLAYEGQGMQDYRSGRLPSLAELGSRMVGMQDDLAEKAEGHVGYRSRHDEFSLPLNSQGEFEEGFANDVEWVAASMQTTLSQLNGAVNIEVFPENVRTQLGSIASAEEYMQGALALAGKESLADIKLDASSVSAQLDAVAAMIDDNDGMPVLLGSGGGGHVDHVLIAFKDPETDEVVVSESSADTGVTNRNLVDALADGQDLYAVSIAEYADLASVKSQLAARTQTPEAESDDAGISVDVEETAQSLLRTMAETGGFLATIAQVLTSLLSQVFGEDFAQGIESQEADRVSSPRSNARVDFFEGGGVGRS